MKSLMSRSSLSLIVILMPALKHEMKHEVNHSYINHILLLNTLKLSTIFLHRAITYPRYFQHIIFILRDYINERINCIRNGRNFWWL